MAKFDLKTAVSLIPVMDGSEDMTKRIIDSIDLYSSMIEATEQSSLINFVLKTRLTESAKLRLEKTYTSCSILIADIRKHLLTTKSSTALHSQLFTCSQGSRSIEEYGKSLEELFTQLTVSQADGNTSAYNILKPLNEKLAVHRFADGLRNKNLNLILTARNYDSLKDVIQAAKEEELSSNRNEPRESMFYARRGGRGNFNQVRYPSYNQRGRGAAQTGQTIFVDEDLLLEKGPGVVNSTEHVDLRLEATTCTIYIAKSKVKLMTIILPKPSFFDPKFINAFTSSNSIDTIVNSLHFKWMVDTGASLSVVKYEAVRHLPIVNDVQEIKGIGGKIITKGFINLKVCMQNLGFIHTFYVIENMNFPEHGILGRDFLRKYKAIVDYEINTVTLKLNSETITMPMDTGYLGKNYYIDIPPRCEKFYFVSTNLKDDCVVFPKQLCDGVFIAGSISKPNNEKLRIQILNCRDETIRLSYFNPEVEQLSEYVICSYEKNESDGNRVRRMFEELKLDSLNLEERKCIENICAKYSDIFQLKGDRLSATNIYSHHIHLKNNNPVYTKPYRLPYAQREEIECQVQNMLKNDIIEPAASEWSSPVLLVPKKDDGKEKKWRLVIDFRKLNDRIIDDKFPLPNISDILDALSGSMYFTHLDLYQSYYQLTLDPKSRKYTAFTTHTGQYQMKRMPMGLKTSPNAFSRAMTVAMSGLNYEKCLIYLDDLVCFGRNLHQHNQNLIAIFERLRKVNLKLNPAKCVFLQKELLYLGHVVSSDGIQPDPNKSKVIENYPIPKSAEEVKRFIAFANYYRKFIPQFAKLCIPLNKLTRKNVIFSWDINCQEAFIKIKKSLLSPPLLQYPILNNDNIFILQTDASGYAIGSVLCNQDRRPVSFASRTLNKAECNYPTVEKELLSILEEYDFVIEHVRGRDNVAADALSRIRVTSDELKDIHANIRMMVMTRAMRKIANEATTHNQSDDGVSNYDWSDQPRVVEVLRKPKDYVELNFVSKTEWQKCKSCVREENKYFAYLPNEKILFVKPEAQSQCTRRVFARDLCLISKKLKINNLYIVRTNENIEIIKKLSKCINKSKEWSGLRLHVIQGVRKIISNDDKRVILNDYHLLATSGHAGIRRMINNIRQKYFWTGLEKDVTEFVRKCDQCQRQKHFKYIKEPMVITDTSGSSFDRILIDLVGPLDKDLYNYTYILTVQCNLTKFMQAYPLENKETNTVASTLTKNEPREWSTWLPYWCFAYNTTVHSETKYTPYELVYGKPCNIPSNLVNSLEPLYNYSSYPHELKFRLQKSQMQARENLCKSKDMRKLRYDGYINPISYKKGDFVLLKNENRKKFDPLYIGPYLVIKEISPNVIILFKGTEKTVHKNNTKLYYN
ncbi:unnamed protein product [Euphydryas editha]|uniref:RNA-directed DNA polymerase n=1 Tax=Euphydryas editha TaxID=104508 RepID=A0AAU9T9I6_EUPED|nr:unnamed protein product [Euphydryas editha]